MTPSVNVSYSSPSPPLPSGKEQVNFLLPLVVGFGNNHNSLDSGTNLNWTRGDWALVYGASTLSLLRERDGHQDWTFPTDAPIHRYETDPQTRF